MIEDVDPRNIKDKCIKLEKFQYRAEVHLYDGRVIDVGLFQSIHLAQMFLADYPDDVFGGSNYLSNNKPVM